jgi:hypothetical protein
MPTTSSLTHATYTAPQPSFVGAADVQSAIARLRLASKMREVSSTYPRPSPRRVNVVRNNNDMLSVAAPSPRFCKHDRVKFYRGYGLSKARVVVVTPSEYLVHYYTTSSNHDANEFVPHYRVIEDMDASTPTNNNSTVPSLRDTNELQTLRDENRRLRAELKQANDKIHHIEADMSEEWVKECAALQAKCALVSDHCKEAVKRVHDVLDDKQRVIDSWNCVVCISAPVNCVLVPCGHVFCNDCGTKFDGKCPICRREFILRLPIFKP